MLDWNLKSTWDLSYTSREFRQYEIPGYWRVFQRDHANTSARKVAALIARLSITETTSIAIIGGGFGYLQEDLVTRLPAIPIATTEISTWIQSVKNDTETVDIQNMVNSLPVPNVSGEFLDYTIPGSDGERIFNFMDVGALESPNITRATINLLDNDISNNGLRNAVKSEAGIANNTDFDWVISDDVLPTLSDAEAVTLSTRMNAMTTPGKVIHIVTPGRLDGADQAGGAFEDLDFNWHTLAEWKTIVGSDGVFSVVTFEAAV